jgi:hypothetical protein
MLRLVSPFEHAPAPRRRLAVEWLESRDCPSSFMPTSTPSTDLSTAAPGTALTLTVSHTYLSGHNVHFTGAVSGPGAGNAMVEFQGEVSGLVVPNADGTFDFTATAAGLGNVLVGAVAGPNVVSNVASDPIANDAPVIVNFAVKQLDSTTYQFTGKVLDEYPAGLVVVFGGQPVSLQGQKATVQSDGTFSLTVTMAQGSADTGTADVQVQSDWWGASSDYAFALVS